MYGYGGTFVFNPIADKQQRLLHPVLMRLRDEDVLRAAKAAIDRNGVRALSRGEVRQMLEDAYEKGEEFRYRELQVRGDRRKERRLLRDIIEHAVRRAGAGDGARHRRWQNRFLVEQHERLGHLPSANRMQLSMPRPSLGPSRKNPSAAGTSMWV